MQNPISKLRQRSIISKKAGFLSENEKLWQVPTTTEFNKFFWNFAHVFYLLMSTKRYLGFVLFCLDLELLIKM